MLTRLGIDGMSTDESDNETAPMNSCSGPRFIVKQPIWRSQTVGDFLHIIDSANTFRRKRFPNMRGSFPYIREHRRQEYSVTSKVVMGPPVNAYRASWLATQNYPEYLVRHLEYNYNFNQLNGVFE